MQCQVLVRFKGRDDVVFDVGSHEDFLKLVDQIAKPWGKWIFVGSNAAVRKSDVESVFYFAEGYAQSCKSCMS